MGDSLFDIFGDATRLEVKNVSRLPLLSNENMGKTISSGPMKPNEPSQPVKKIDTNLKRSFLSNTGKALQSTPIHPTFTPGVKVRSVIYSDDNNAEAEELSFAEIEFTRPTYRYDNNETDMFDYLPLPEVKVSVTLTPPKTPPPLLMNKPTINFDCSYDDDFYTDDFSIDSLPEVDLNLPDLF
ncbi:unnamed protein product [Leptosia nina]|uniref:Securin n=1 Tax=Leptosia nina TaxID=320188 RepID=A0AAV1JAA5_9NEOP